MYKQTNLKRFFGQGGGDREQESKSDEPNHLKRKSQQKEYDKHKRKRTVQTTWLAEFEWLSYDEKTDTMYCNLCRKYPSLANKESTLVKGINEKFRRESLFFHGKSKAHIKCVEHDFAINNPKDTAMAQSDKKINEKKFLQLDKLFSTAYFVAIECESFLEYPAFVNLQLKNGLNLGFNYQNDHACADFVNSIASVLRQETMAEVANVRYFSILSDGSTDRGIIEQELIFV